MVVLDLETSSYFLHLVGQLNYNQRWKPNHLTAPSSIAFGDLLP